MQLLWVNEHTKVHHIVFHNRYEHCIFVEIVIFAERMQFIEFRRIDFELDIHCWLRLKLNLLIGKTLKTKMLQVVKSYLIDGFKIEFRLWLNKIMTTHTLFSIARIERKLKIIVAIVDDIQLHICGLQLLNIFRHKSQIHSKLFAIGSLITLIPSVFRHFYLILFILLNLRFHSCFRSFLVIYLFYWVFYWEVIFISFLYHNHLRHKTRSLKTIFLLYQYYIFRLKACNHTTSYRIEITHLISNLNIYCHSPLYLS